MAKEHNENEARISRNGVNQQHSWLNVATNRPHRVKTPMKYVEPSIDPRGVIRVRLPISVVADGRKKWVNCLVGSFIEKKMLFFCCSKPGSENVETLWPIQCNAK